MPTKMNYQQARRVRKSKWTDLFVDQLVDKGVAGAIGKTISLKTQAKIKGIKEKFDPLNIAKFMTFGSKLGPALYGKLMGRDQKDIDYFTGRLKHVRVTDKKAEKLKAINAPTGMEDSKGINDQLSKIYTFLQKTHEQNVKQKELSKNQEESINMMKEKRHKELMDTLKNLTNSLGGGGSETLVPVEKKENWFDKIKKMFEDFAKDFDWKKYIKDIPWTKLLAVLRWFSGPIGLALLGITSAVMFAQWLKGWIATNVADRNQITPEEAVNLLRNGTEKDMAPYGGRLALMDLAKGGHIKAAEILERGDIKEINDAGGMEFLQKVVEKGAVDMSNIPDKPRDDNTQKSVEPRPTKGGTALKYHQDQWDKRNAGKFDPITGKRLDDRTPEEQAKFEEQQRTAPGVKKQLLAEPLKPVETATEPVSKPPEPKAVPAPAPATNKVSALTDKNAELNLPAKSDELAQAVTSTVTNLSKGGNERVGMRPSQIAVRNDCDTFTEMIVNSTRIV